MAEYIEREAARKELRKHFSFCTGAAVSAALNDVPAADVAPVVHGEWVEYDRFVCNSDGEPVDKIGVTFVCSECGREADFKEPYCHCGAKMDLKGGNHAD